MKINLIAVVLILFVSVYSYAYEFSENNSYNLSDYLSNFLFTAKPKYESLLEIESIPARWKTQFLDLRKANWQIAGEVFITFLGKFPMNYRDGKKQKLPWDIVVNGSRNKIESITLSPNELAFGKQASGAHFALSTALSAIRNIKFKKIRRRLMSGTGEYFYLIDLYDGKHILAKVEHNMGSGGYTTSATFFYHIPESKEKLQDFIEVHSLISKEDHNPNLDDFE